jgi:hypothetical protein
MIFAHLVIYLIPLIGFTVELSVGWAVIRDSIDRSCDIAFTNRYVQTFNLICGFVLLILLNIIVIYYNACHVHLTSHLHGARHHVSAREKYHRSLVIQFLVFYTVWLSLWSPNLIVYQFTSGMSTITQIVSLLNFIEITLDPIIISTLDVRFQELWHNLWIRLKNTIYFNQRNQRRVEPIASLSVRVQQQTLGNIT